MCDFYGDRDIICDVSLVVNFYLFVQCKNFWRITSDRLMELHFGVANEGSGIWPKIVSET